jgi:hypothetical protein
LKDYPAAEDNWRAGGSADQPKGIRPVGRQRQILESMIRKIGNQFSEKIMLKQ